MWTPATRKNYSRNGLRYQSDVTDEEWRVIEPYLPPAKGIGRPRGWPLREIVNGIFYVMRSGCPWRQLPKDLPPWSTVYRWFAAWRDACLFEKINHALVITGRERVGREASPSAAIIDSQSIKTTEADAFAVEYDDLISTVVDQLLSSEALQRLGDAGPSHAQHQR